MTPRKKRAERKTRDLGDYRHEEARRKNNPEVGLSSWEPKQKTPPKVKYECDPHLDPQLPLIDAVEFYQHDADWANRLILGDSLLVMNLLLQREVDCPTGGNQPRVVIALPAGRLRAKNERYR
jgi:hypothetical protein